MSTNDVQGVLDYLRGEQAFESDSEPDEALDDISFNIPGGLRIYMFQMVSPGLRL